MTTGMTSSSSSFVHNFWDESERGVSVIEQKFKNSKQTFEELSNFYKERIALEEEYGRRLNSMTRKAATGSTEQNRTAAFFESLRVETEQMARAHSTQAAAISNEVHKPLDSFMSSFRARKRSIEATISKVLKYKRAIDSKMEAVRAKYENECLRFRAMSADKFLLDGNELRKLTTKLAKVEESIMSVRQEYYELYKEAIEIHEKFIREWKAALSQYQELEEERIKFLRSNVWTYCNLMSVSCVNVDAACENVRLSLEKCEARTEIEDFVHRCGTGNKIPAIPKFIDYISPNSNENQDVYESSAAQSIERGALPSTQSSSTVKITKKAPPKEISEQSNAFLMLNKRSDQTRAEINEHAEKELEDNHETSTKLGTSRNTRLNPPSSDYSDPSTHRHSHNSSSNYNPSSQYSEPTDISLHNQAAGDQKHWNSPQRRRRSRGSLAALSDYSSSNYEPNASTASNNSKRKSFILSKEDDIELPNDDILRSTLRDLQMGGNGDMNALKKSIRPKSMQFETLVAGREDASRGKSRRPKSMLLDTQVSKIMEPAMAASAARPNNTARPDGLPAIGPLSGRPVIKYCKAIYSYNAKEQDECSFRKKDTILVLDDGDLWWSVEVLGKQEIGQAPSNYLSPI